MQQLKWDENTLLLLLISLHLLLYCTKFIWNEVQWGVTSTLYTSYIQTHRLHFDVFYIFISLRVHVFIRASTSLVYRWMHTVADTRRMEVVIRSSGCEVNHLLLSCVHVSITFIGSSHTSVSGDLYKGCTVHSAWDATKGLWGGARDRRMKRKIT